MGAHRLHHRPRVRAEDFVVTLLCTLAGPLLWWFGTTAGAESEDNGGLTVVAQSVAALCAAAGAVIAVCWLVALTGVALTVCGHRWRSAGLTRFGRRLSPAFLRRVAASILGVNLLLAPGAWADAHPGTDRLTPHAASSAGIAMTAPQAAEPHPGWLRRTGVLPSAQTVSASNPGLPSPAWTPRSPRAPAPGANRASRPSTAETTTVAVRRGDCLWDIAAQELGITATDLEVDRRWRQWYRHNQELIGAEADLLQPGMVLTAPPFD